MEGDLSCRPGSASGGRGAHCASESSLSVNRGLCPCRFMTQQDPFPRGCIGLQKTGNLPGIMGMFGAKWCQKIALEWSQWDTNDANPYYSIETLSSNINNGLDEITHLEYTLGKSGKKAFLIPVSRVQVTSGVPHHASFLF